MINCIAVDDERLALELLEDNIRKVPFLNLIATCSSAKHAIEVVQSEKIDLVFLDIEMPEINGLQLVKGLVHKPAVIFITAYEKYAIDGYDLDVVDYLLKPVMPERFLKAATKAFEYIRFLHQDKAEEQGNNNIAFIFVRSERKILKLNTSDILYIEGLKDYAKIFTGTKPILSLVTLKHLEDILPEKEFVRIHRSFIIALSKINYISRSSVYIGEKSIPVSNFYRDSFFKRISDNTGKSIIF
ncbi:MAG: response regulator transcription factor [Bacteroidales bacterium]|nr:response regulator transcription factor [Bacteroidales bacterium]HOY39493.1 LytTR family DNA-binding domain-containing protein [Bacteroidales bacterium]